MQFDAFGGTEGRMFLGTVDDAVSRYPWTSVSADLETLNHTLIFHSLLGPKLCCRIGNIIYHPAYFKGLLDPDLSPLMELAKSGFIQLQMLDESINKTIEKRLDWGTNSTEAFVQKYQWARGSNIYSALDQVDSALEPGIGKRLYSAKFRDHFLRMISELSPDEDGAFGKVFSRWLDECHGDNLTRSNFERIALRDFSKQPKAIFEAMGTINVVNHYAYGVGMLSDGDDLKPYIDTRELSSLARYTNSYFDEDDDRVIEYERLDELIASRALDTIRQNLQIPSEILEAPEVWPAYARLVVTEDFRFQKNLVLSEIKKLIDGKNSPAATNSLRDACREYSKYITNELELKNSKSISPVFELSIKFGGETAQELASGGFGAALKSIATGAVASGGLLASGTEAATGVAAGLFVSFAASQTGPKIRRLVDSMTAHDGPHNRIESIRMNNAILGALSIKRIEPDWGKEY